MKIIHSKNFQLALNELLEFIAQRDGVNRALNFRDELLIEIDKIYPMPKKHRKNSVLNDESVRDLIFKGYVVPFQIHADRIEILSIYKSNLCKPKSII